MTEIGFRIIGHDGYQNHPDPVRQQREIGFDKSMGRFQTYISSNSFEMDEVLIYFPLAVLIAADESNRSLYISLSAQDNIRLILIPDLIWENNWGFNSSNHDAHVPKQKNRFEKTNLLQSKKKLIEANHA